MRRVADTYSIYTDPDPGPGSGSELEGPECRILQNKCEFTSDFGLIFKFFSSFKNAILPLSRKIHRMRKKNQFYAHMQRFYHCTVVEKNFKETQALGSFNKFRFSISLFPLDHPYLSLTLSFFIPHCVS
jgi:hypothetical protein